MTGAVHVLIVEDDPSTAATLAERLQQEGYVVSCAHTGRAALEFDQAGLRAPQLAPS
jgi:DNA-binding response OmpR family regulator